MSATCDQPVVEPPLESEQEMRLNELQNLVIQSQPEDWHMIPAGAFFTDAPNIDTGSFEQHDYLLVYREDVDLTIQWGMRARGFDHVEKAKQLWPNAAFPDPAADVYHVDAFWRGVLVDRENVVSVDGCRAYLPLGSSRVTNWEGGGGPAPEVPEYEHTATPWQAALARVVDNDRDEHDSYMSRAGLVVR